MILFRQRLIMASIVFTIPVLSIFLASHAFALTVGEITKGFSCTCNCNMLVSACEGSMECSAAKQITNKVAQMVDEGQSKDAIMRYFVETNGERILAAPTKRGFNLTAWILPFLAILLGGGGLYVFLNRCMSSKKSAPAGHNFANGIQTPSQKHLDQFEKELNAFDR